MKSCKRWAAAARRRRDLCDGRVQGGVAFGKKAKPSTPMDKLMHNDYMTGNTLPCHQLVALEAVIARVNSTSPETPSRI